MAEQQTTAAALSDIVDKIGAGLAEVGAQIADKAPHAWALVVQGGHAEAAAQLAVGLMLLMVTISVAVSLRACVVNLPTFEDDPTPRTVAPVIGCVVLGMLMIPFSLAALRNLFDSHAIAMLIAPEATTARDLLMRAL